MEVATPEFNPQYPLLVTSSPSNTEGLAELSGVISDPLGLGDLRYGRRQQSVYFDDIQSDDEYRIDEEEAKMEDPIVDIQQFFTLGGKAD